MATSEVFSIALTILGILAELLIVIGLARRVDGPQLSKQSLLFCAAVGLGIPGVAIVILVVGFTWGTEPLLIGALLLASIPGNVLGAYAIWAFVRWLNSRHKSGYQPSPRDSRQRANVRAFE